MGKRTKARECALQMLYQWDMTRDPMGRVVESFWKVRSTTEATREMAERLAWGASKECDALDETITAASRNWRFERIAAIDKNILRLAVYEIGHRDDIPSSVSVNEAVEIAKKYSTEDSGKFVNGILGSYLRQRQRPS